MALEFKDIKIGGIYYKKQHEVRVEDRVTLVSEFGQHAAALEITYLNQPAHMSPAITGPGNLTEAPLHCYNCRTKLIDRIPLDECNACRRIVCPACQHCHCGTTWDPNK